MITLTVLFFTAFLLIAISFIVDDKIVSKLPNTNKFKQWWRKHYIGESED